ncbi:MAG: DUF3426 domain-containing protein [Deltaproteobacteria bacterium]|nr:DUF3426 domain-containing protein [Deltaproteobacteria bacterium]
MDTKSELFDLEREKRELDTFLSTIAGDGTSVIPSATGAVPAKETPSSSAKNKSAFEALPQEPAGLKPDRRAVKMEAPKPPGRKDKAYASEFISKIAEAQPDPLERSGQSGSRSDRISSFLSLDEEKKEDASLRVKVPSGVRPLESFKTMTRFDRTIKPEEDLSLESKPLEIKPPEPKLWETKLPEPKLPESKLRETKPPETKPPEPKLWETKLPEMKPPEPKPREAKPPEMKPPESKLRETKLPETKPRETKPPETKPLPEVKKAATDVKSEKKAEAAGPYDYSPKKGLGKGKWIGISIIVIILLLAGYLGFFSKSFLPGVKNLFKTELGSSASAAKGINLLGVRQRLVYNMKLGKTIRVVEGVAENSTSQTVSKIKIAANLFAADGALLASMESFGGQILVDAQLENLDEAGLVSELNKSKGSDDKIPPRGQIPFMIIFTKELAGVHKLSVSAIDYAKH